MVSRCHLCIIFILVLWIVPISTFASDFSGNDYGFIDNPRYRGWIWFEDKEGPQAKKRKEEVDHQYSQITPDEAAYEIEALKKELDDKRNIMIARPSAETVRDYVALEDVMWEKALLLDNSYRQAKFKYPDLFDKLENPQNVHAVKFKRKLEQEALEGKIKAFARKFDLVLFSRGNCGYCKEFAPILQRFSETYGFKTEEASIDGEMTGLFKGKKMAELAVKLGIEATPTVVVVSKDGSMAFELIRGYAVISELEEYVGLAISYVQEQQRRSTLR